MWLETTTHRGLRTAPLLLLLHHPPALAWLLPLGSVHPEPRKREVVRWLEKNTFDLHKKKEYTLTKTVVMCIDGFYTSTTLTFYLGTYVIYKNN